MPPIVSSTWPTSIGVLELITPPAGSRGGGERGGAHHALMLEVEEQPVGAGAGNLGEEPDRRASAGLAVARLPVGMDMEVGQVTGPQRDQVPVGGQVGLQIDDRLTAPADGERD